jgi:hypothetical protein
MWNAQNIHSLGTYNRGMLLLLLLLLMLMLMTAAAAAAADDKQLACWFR